MTDNMAVSIQREVTTLDVLWAFYQSQPKRVRKAFRTKMEAEEKKASAQWQTDLKDIKALKENWDGEGARPVNRDAIRNAQKLMNMLTSIVALNARLYPTSLGAVMVKLESKKGRIKGEIGDKQMSYFVKRQDVATEYHSFEDLTKENMAMFVSNLESIV